MIKVTVSQRQYAHRLLVIDYAVGKRSETQRLRLCCWRFCLRLKGECVGVRAQGSIKIPLMSFRPLYRHSRSMFYCRKHSVSCFAVENMSPECTLLFQDMSLLYLLFSSIASSAGYLTSACHMHTLDSTIHFNM